MIFGYPEQYEDPIPGKDFCSSTQDESEEVELVPEVEFDQAVSLGHYGAVNKK